jgi:Kef-type K+ transport system membrane component KefB
MESSAFSVTSLLIVSLLALLVPLLVNRIRAFRIPIVVGEILAGIVVGKSGFNIIHTSDWLNFLQFFGLSYLMFVSGLEIDFGALRLPPTREVQGVRRWLKSAPAFAVFACLVTFGLSYLLSDFLYGHHMVRSPLLMALIITTTSLTVVVPVLKEYDVLSTSFGQLVLAAAVFADFVTMSLISVAVSLFRGGFSASVFLVFVLILVLILLYRVSLRFTGFNALRGLAHGTAQLGIRACLALMMVFIVL